VIWVQLIYYGKIQCCIIILNPNHDRYITEFANALSISALYWFFDIPARKKQWLKFLECKCILQIHYPILNKNVWYKPLKNIQKLCSMDSLLLSLLKKPSGRQDQKHEGDGKLRVIRIEGSEKSANDIDRDAQSMWMTKFSNTFLVLRHNCFF
jgi:hypothetical protein